MTRDAPRLPVTENFEFRNLDLPTCTSASTPPPLLPLLSTIPLSLLLSVPGRGEWGRGGGDGESMCAGSAETPTICVTAHGLRICPCMFMNFGGKCDASSLR